MTTCKEPGEWYYTEPCESIPDFFAVTWRYTVLRNAAQSACNPLDHFGTVANLDNWHAKQGDSMSDLSGLAPK